MRFLRAFCVLAWTMPPAFAAMSCSSFGGDPSPDADAAPGADATPGADAASGADAPGTGATILCGATRCPVGGDSVCCVTAEGSTCTTASACNGAPLPCDDTDDCRQLGFASTHVCCAYNDGLGPKLLLAKCILSTACDASKPEDQMCDPAGAADQCLVKNDGHTECRSAGYTNAPGYAFCQ